MQKIKLVIYTLLILLILYNVFSTVFSQRDKYTNTNYWKKFPALEQTYKDSQYVNKHPKGWIPDESVNAYAGGAYIKGVGPHLIAPDTPPLGRYLIGISALFFNNENIITALAAIVSLIFLYLVGIQIFRSKITALLMATLFSFEPIFKNQLIYTPLLDIQQLAFLLIGFFLFNKGNTTKKRFVYYCGAAIAIGCFIATKFFITGLVVVVAWGMVLLSRKQLRSFILLLLSFSLSITVLLLSYIRVFAYGYSVKAFLGIQKWVYLYHKSQLILPFSIWPLIFLNRWYVWFGNKPVLSDSQWTFMWPVVVAGALLTTMWYVFLNKKKQITVESLIAWVVLYLAFSSVGQITSRYLIICLPIAYVVTFFGIEKIVYYFYETYAHSN